MAGARIAGAPARTSRSEPVGLVGSAVVDDPDAMWKPGYDGPPPVADHVPEQAADLPPGRDDSDVAALRAHSRRRWFGIVALAVVLVAGVVVLDPLNLGDEAGPNDASDGIQSGSPDPSVFGGPAARRLPRGAATLWSVDVAVAGDHWVDVVRRDLVVAAVVEPTGASLDANDPDDSDPPVTTVVAFDAVSGERRWSMQVPARPQEVTVVGAVDDVLVLEQPGAVGPTLTGVDVTTGVTRWSADAAPNAGHVGLEGTPFVARLPVPPDRFVSLIDVGSGRDVGTIVSDSTSGGRPGGWFTDRRGTWYVVDDAEIVGYDLTSEFGEPTIVGSVGVDSASPIVVGDRIVVIDDDGSIAFVDAGASGPVTVSDAVPAPAGSLTPVSSSNFVVTAPGTIAGVAVGGDAVTVVWSRSRGALADDHPIEDGTLVQVATRGGAAMELVDGLTGETVEQLTMASGALQALVVAGDGFVALRSAQLGTRLAGIDLDGTERWSILGSQPVVVGDRIMVRATLTDERLRITTYGDAD